MSRMTIKETLMQQHHLTSEESDNLIEQAKEDVMQRLSCGEDVSNICNEYFGLEPDYLDELV